MKTLCSGKFATLAEAKEIVKRQRGTGSCGNSSSAAIVSKRNRKGDHIIVEKFFKFICIAKGSRENNILNNNNYLKPTHGLFMSKGKRNSASSRKRRK